MEDKLLYEVEPLIGYERELEGLARVIEEHKREDFDFTGLTIWGGLGREVFVDDGEGRMNRGLIPSNTHLRETFELMQTVLIWRLRARDHEGWLKQLIKKPWRIW